MTATLNPAWRLILRLLMAVVCVEICSCQKVSPTSNLEGNHIAFPAPGVSFFETPPKGAEQETPANNPETELTTAESTKSAESNIVMPVIVSGGSNEGIENHVEGVSDKPPSQDNPNCNQTTKPKPDSPTDPDVQDPLQNIGEDATPSGTKDALANMNITEFIQKNCGKAHSRKRRIVGGTISSVTYYPWTVGIFMDGSSKPYCGAVLVTPWFVLTAAHCTRGRIAVDLRVAYGLQTINERTLAERQEHVAVVKEIHQYEKFKDIVHGDDISLLQLKTPLLADGQPVPPICTPQPSQLDRNTVVNTTGVVAGWGRTKYNGESSSDLREVSLPIVSNQECSKVFQDVVKITDGMICAGDITGKKDACQGDSGGPLMWYSSVFERWYVIGVVSFGVKCAEKGYYGTYTWVEKYLDWICEITDRLVCLQTTGGKKKQPATSETKEKLVKSKRPRKRPFQNVLRPSRPGKGRRRKWNLQHQE
uniref:Acrosin n=1 Tax=Ixodes ricinus TaxID=34613 RepID=A0A6B0VBX7_IXORI